MAEKSMIIIGAGLAGLSTGIYAQMNGYTTRIFEQHTAPGGVCTAWKRKGYKIDGCMHWLMGCRPETPLRRIYEEVGALDGNRLLILEEYGRCFDHTSEKEVVFSSDLERLERDMKALTTHPEDHDLIDHILAGIRAMVGYELPLEKAPELLTFFDKLKQFWSMRHLARFAQYQKVQVKELAAGFKDPFLRWAVTNVFMPEMPVLSLFAILGSLVADDLFLVEGGSLEFSRCIAERYKALGGEINCGAEVVKILVEDDRAVGVRLADGREHRADIIVSAADGHSTIFDMLEGKYVNDTIRRRYESWPLFPPITLATFGVAREFPGEISVSNIKPPRPFSVGGKEIQDYTLRIFNYDPTLAPEGKTAVQVMIVQDYDYWKSLRQDPGRYEAEKEKVATVLLEQLEDLYPGITQEVEVTDVATPCTFVRYTSNYRGAFEGWLMSTETQEWIKKTLPGLDNFYRVGQWVEPGGGVPAVLASGRYLIQILCDQQNRPFMASS